MRYIRPFNENNTNLTGEQIDFLNDCTRGKWKLNPDTGLIDVRGSFYCEDKNLDDFKGLQFGKVTGYFVCYNNNLKTLNGSPREVGRSVWCWRNPLISLRGAPLKVVDFFRHDNFACEYNLKTFLKKIKEDRPGVPTELLLTHHFFTPEVIKKEITKDSYFCYYVSRAWNTPPFKKKQDELTKILTEEDLQKIDALWSIGGYL